MMSDARKNKENPEGCWVPFDRDVKRNFVASAAEKHKETVRRKDFYW